MPNMPDYRRAANALEFVAKQAEFSLDVVEVSKRPGSDFPSGSLHYVYTLTGPNGFEAEGYYSKGPGHMLPPRDKTLNPKSVSYQKASRKPPLPTVSEVLGALACDASCIEYVDDVAEFMIEFGYTEDLDSIRKGSRAFEACKATAREFNKLPNRQLECISRLSSML